MIILATFYGVPGEALEGHRLWSSMMTAICIASTLYVCHLLRYYFFIHTVWRLRRDLKVHKSSTILLMPFYNKVQGLYRWYGWWRSVLLYIPIVPSPPQTLGKRPHVQELSNKLLSIRE